jgi:transposase
MRHGFAGWPGGRRALPRGVVCWHLRRSTTAALARRQPASAGSVQTIRDWVLRFNPHGPEGLAVVDQAGWHRSARLVVPDNITLVVLPPKCPELNPAENVWQFMRDNWLSNRVFASYTDLVDHCCMAWNKLIERPWTIMSIGLRDWANGF